MREVENKIIHYTNYFYYRITILLLFIHIVTLSMNLYYHKTIPASFDFFKLCLIFPTNYLIYKTPNIDFKKMGVEASVFYILLISLSIIFCFPITPFVVSYIVVMPIFFLMFFNFKNSILLTLINLILISLGYYVNQKTNLLSNLWGTFDTDKDKETYRMIANAFHFACAFSIFFLTIYYYTLISVNRSLLRYITTNELGKQENFEMLDPNFMIKKEGSALDQTKLFNEIDFFIKSKKPWLDSNYNLQQLAKDVNSNTMYVSAAINSVSKKNFKTYINEYRLDHFLKLMESQKDEGASSNREVYLDCGFSSKITFDRVFKSRYGKDNHIK